MESLTTETLANAALAFRGYNVTNLGRTPDLLSHDAYGPIVRRHLVEASRIASEHSHRKFDLIERVTARRESTLATFAEDIALIVSVELAHLEMLRQFHGLDYHHAKLSFGYSLGEVTALVAGGVFRLEDVLGPLLGMADDCAELATDVTMGVLFSIGPALDLTAIERHCLHICAQGQGVIAISAQLAPNAVLLLGQGETVDRFRETMHPVLPKSTHLRKNTNRWPPLHTPLLWQRQIPNRAAWTMFQMPGGFVEPSPRVLSLVTGEISYNDFNSRTHLSRWLDEPQRLWDAIYATLTRGIETVIHLGPEPNLIPATYKRLSDNIAAQVNKRTMGGFGLRAVTGMARRPWLTAILPSRTALLRTPFVRHVILEDWFLENPPR
jgi:[acyl-carrier-protein] S-malonyltransferase